MEFKFQFKLEGNITTKSPEVPTVEAIHTAEEIPFMVLRNFVLFIFMAATHLGCRLNIDLAN
jgi:hypothetical protein